MQFGHFLGKGEQFGHATKWNAFEVQIQPRGDDPNAIVGEEHAYLRKSSIEELRFINGNHRNGAGLSRKVFDDCTTGPHGNRGQRVLIVGRDMIFLVPGIGSRFEDDGGLVRDLGPAHAPEQLFRFARKHRPADHFNTAFAEAGMLEGCVFFVGDHVKEQDLVFEINSVATLQTQVVESILKRTFPMKIWPVGIVVGLGLVGCTRTAGEGGIAVVTGTVEVEQRVVITNPTGAVIAPAADEDVYIIYGDRVGPDDRVQTNYDGEFAFYGLRPGDYTVYVYSEDTLPPFNNAPDIPIIRTFTIEDGEEAKDLGTIRVYKDI